MPLPARELAAQRGGDATAANGNGSGRSLTAVLRAGVKRFLLLLALTSAATVFVSLLLGVLAGAAVDRAVSLGFYVVGSFLVVAGFFVGNRGPVRPGREDRDGFLFIPPTRRRWATAEEHGRTIDDSAIFVAIGFALLVLGILADSRHELF